MGSRLWALAALVLGARIASPPVSANDVTATLRRQTQELLDAVSAGSAAVWDRYLDSTVSITTEDGSVRSKREMVGDIRPLPKTISGLAKDVEAVNQ